MRNIARAREVLASVQRMRATLDANQNYLGVKLDARDAHGVLEYIQRLEAEITLLHDHIVDADEVTMHYQTINAEVEYRMHQQRVAEAETLRKQREAMQRVMYTSYVGSIFDKEIRK